jgi:hypothetical protein
VPVELSAIASAGYDAATRTHPRVTPARTETAPALTPAPEKSVAPENSPAPEKAPAPENPPSPATASTSQLGIYSIAIGSQHRAAIVEQTADGFTASFPSVPRAVARAATLQEAEARLAQLIDLLA